MWGHLMSQREPSKGDRGGELKEKTSISKVGSKHPVVFPLVKNQNVRVDDFYPAMLENEEDNIVKLPFYDQDNVCFGP
jgi:hypothetical protein